VQNIRGKWTQWALFYCRPKQEVLISNLSIVQGPRKDRSLAFSVRWWRWNCLLRQIKLDHQKHCNRWRIHAARVWRAPHGERMSARLWWVRGQSPPPRGPVAGRLSSPEAERLYCICSIWGVGQFVLKFKILSGVYGRNIVRLTNSLSHQLLNQYKYTLSVWMSVVNLLREDPWVREFLNPPQVGSSAPR